jgi:hypothetical protein
MWSRLKWSSAGRGRIALLAGANEPARDDNAEKIRTELEIARYSRAG